MRENRRATSLTSLELCDVLISRASGSTLGELAEELRCAILAEQSPTFISTDAVRTAFDLALEICGLPANVDLTRRFRRGHANAPVHRARHLAMYLLWHVGRLSTVQIAREFGLKDHTTVIYGRDKISARMLTDAVFSHRVQNAIAVVKGRPTVSEGAA